MRRRAEGRRIFFEKHPYCCFCGGHRASEEEDHFPSRALFTDRQWPEGYVFPACKRCNHVSQGDELIIAMLSRIYLNDSERMTEAEFLRTTEPVRSNFPGLVESMRPTTHRELRALIARSGLGKPPGKASTDIPVLSLADPRFADAIFSFGRKLGLALIYKHTERPLPMGGVIALRRYTNLEISKNEIPREFADGLPEFPNLVRANRSLNEQFFYRVGVDREKMLGMFLAIFRKSFGIVGFFSADPARLAATSTAVPNFIRLVTPYEWPSEPGPVAGVADGTDDQEE